MTGPMMVQNVRRKNTRCHTPCFSPPDEEIVDAEEAEEDSHDNVKTAGMRRLGLGDMTCRVERHAWNLADLLNS